MRRLPARNIVWASRLPTRHGLRNCAILFAVFLNARAQGADSSSDAPCPGAASWKRGHPALAEALPSDRDGDTAVADAALLSDLKARVETDQGARRKWLAVPKAKTLAAR